MNILLLGHEGYLGSAIMPLLQAAGHQVFGWSRAQDVLTLTAADLARLKIQAVLNFAAAMNRTVSRYESASIDHRVNVLGVQHVVQCLSKTDIKLIHISTKDVFGEVWQPKDVTETATRYQPQRYILEQQPFSPLTPYAKSKLMGEWMTEAHAYTNIIRLSTCYTTARHMRGNWVMNFSLAAHRQQTVTLTGNGKQVRDLLHVADLSTLILRMLAQENTTKWGVTVHAGGGESNIFSVREVAQLIDPALKIAYAGTGDLGFAFDIRLAQELFHWQPVRQFVNEVSTLHQTVGASL